MGKRGERQSERERETETEKESERRLFLNQTPFTSSPRWGTMSMGVVPLNRHSIGFPNYRPYRVSSREGTEKTRTGETRRGRQETQVDSRPERRSGPNGEGLGRLHRRRTGARPHLSDQGSGLR